MNTVSLYVIEFFFYSAAGWFVESTNCSIGEKRIINRGFLFGPMCPIYGTGALVLTIFIYNPFRDKPLYVFLIGMVLCDIVEYITSFLMEKLFNARWWDYTYEFLNIRGRICLKHTLYWGIASIAFVEVIHPHIDKMLLKLNGDKMIYIAAAIFAVFLIDVIHSVIKALDIRKLHVKMQSLIDTFSGGFDSVRNTIEDKYADLQLKLDNQNEKITDFRNEVFEQVQDVISQFELRFSKKSKDKNDKNKYSSRFLHNNFSVEQTIRKQLGRLRQLRDDIKSYIYDTDEMQ